LQISARELNALDLHPVLQADMEIALRDLRPDLLLEMDRLQPTGAENPEAAFVSRGLRTVRWRTVGADRKHLKITLTDGKVVFDGIAFARGIGLNLCRTGLMRYTTLSAIFITA
jgi:single-stranded-DNA-specific exonuclease